MKKLNLLIVLVIFASSVFLYSRLPEVIPIHWNFRGEIDNYMPKNIAVWLMPALTTLMLIGFKFLPAFDPKKSKYKLFKKEWEIIQTALIGFFAYLQFIIFYISLNPTVVMMPLMFIGLGALFVLVGNYLSKIRQNYFIGIKVPWTLANEDNWNKTHRFASWCFVIAGILTLAEAFFVWQAPMVIFGSFMLVLFLPIIYSFLLYKKSLAKMKYIYLALILIIGLVFTVRLLSGEDDWLCVKGEWVKHGQPAAPRPQTACLNK
jgi:uncharacterized membrane protein